MSAEAGAPIARLGAAQERAHGRAVVVKELCAELDGFSLHAAMDVLKCARRGSRRRWIAAITRGETSVRILEHLGLESHAPPPAPGRAPPQLELGWEGA